MNLKSKRSKDSEELFESVYEHLTNIFVFLSSFLSAVVVGWFAYLILHKCWVYFGILQPHVEGLSLGVFLEIPIFYSIYNSKLTDSDLSPRSQFKLISTQLFWVFLSLTVVLNLDMLVPIFRNSYEFFLSLLSPTI